MRAADLGSDIKEVLYTEEQVHQRVVELAAQIDADYQDREVVLVGVLNGAVMTLADLCRSMNSHMTMDWMAVSSYGVGTTSSGVVRILKDLSGSIEGKDVLIVEDIIDSGLTLSWLLRNLRNRNPKSLEVVTLLRKPDVQTAQIDLLDIGFDIPNEFVIGYGLDYAEKYRNLDFVGTLAPHVYS